MTDCQIVRVGSGKLVGGSGSNHCEAHGGRYKLLRLEKVPFHVLRGLSCVYSGILGVTNHIFPWNHVPCLLWDLHIWC